MKSKQSLVVKVIALVIGILFVFNSLSSWLIYRKIKCETELQIHKQIEGSLYGISANIDGDRLQELMQKKEADGDYYEELHQYLANGLEKGAFKYLYTVGKFEDGKFYYAVDSLAQDQEDFSSFGDPIEISEETGDKVEESALMTGHGFTSIQYYDEWGYILTGYVAITNSKGEPVALLGADVQASDYNQRISELSQGVWITLMVSLIGMSCLLGGYLFFVLKPLGVVAGAADGIAKGDLTIQMESKGQDEIGRIVNAFITMVKGLNKLIGKMRESAKVLSYSAKQLLVQSQQLNVASEKVSIEALAIREHSEISQDHLKELLIKIEKMDKEAANGMKSTERVCESVQRSYEKALEGKNIIEETSRYITGTNKSMQEAKNQVDHLEIQSIKAFKLIEQISHIAVQTRLLAFNASIEATRAKAAGAGFEVVAREIGKLAMVCAAVAAETKEILGAIQTHTTHLGQTVEKSCEEMIQTVNISNQATKRFDEIVDYSFVSIQDAQHVKHAVEDYMEQMQEVSKGISRASVYAYGLLERGEHILEVSQEQLSSSEELTQCAEGLEDISTSLDDLMKAFKLRDS